MPLYIEVRLVEVGRGENKGHLEYRFVYRQRGYPELTHEWSGGWVGVWDKTDPQSLAMGRVMCVELPIKRR